MPTMPSIVTNPSLRQTRRLMVSFLVGCFMLSPYFVVDVYKVTHRGLFVKFFLLLSRTNYVRLQIAFRKDGGMGCAHPPSTCLLVHHQHAFIGAEVGVLGILGGSSPHSLALGWLGLWGFHVCKDDVTIKLTFIDVLGGCIEVCTTTGHTFPRSFRTFLPHKDFFLGNLGVEWNYGKLGILRQDPIVPRRTRQACSSETEPDWSIEIAIFSRSGHTFTTVNVRETLVDASRGRPFVRSLRGLDEVSKNLAPVDFWLDEILDSLASVCTDSAPTTTVCS
jgi:hypothetical protein